MEKKNETTNLTELLLLWRLSAKLALLHGKMASPNIVAILAF